MYLRVYFSLVSSLYRLDKKTHSHSFCRDIYPNDLAVNHRADPLDVGLELPLGNAADI